MNSQKKSNQEVAAQPEAETPGPFVSRRMFVGAAALASAGFMGATALGQTRSEQQAGRTLPSSSDPGPENKSLLEENPNSNTPPFTDHGNPGPIWFSFDLAPKRMQGGGWTHQVTQRELPPSKDLAGVNMRLTAGSFRELHWHTADEWAIMLTGSASLSSSLLTVLSTPWSVKFSTTTCWLSSPTVRPIRCCVMSRWRKALMPPTTGLSSILRPAISP